MLSCDTFAISKKNSAFSQSILVKNSDRPLGEAQPLIWEKGGIHSSGEQVQCTYLTIPQAPKTYSVLGSRPYWMWGFEMGINECGVVIANEAQGSKNSAETQEGLLGMDMLRLGLERGKTAHEAMHIIIEMLETYGQNANASALFDRRYENSFMLMDSKEIWLLETAGRQWIAKKIDSNYGISNCYTIEEEYDECSQNLIELASKNHWSLPNKKFNFAKSYTLPASRQTFSVPRLRRLNKLLNQNSIEQFNFDACKKICRDHFDGELIEPRFDAAYGTFFTICMHAMTWDNAQTTASLMSTYDEDLGVISRHAFSVPCCSVFMPLYFTGYIPKPMQEGAEKYNENSMWWVLERLSMLISIDYNRFAPNVKTAFSKLEADFELQAKENEIVAASHKRIGNVELAYDILNAQMGQHCAEIINTSKILSEEIKDIVISEGGLCGPRTDFLLDYSKRTDMPLI